jgi:excisionase family DNA binding protein
MNTPSKLLNVKQAAERLSCCPSTVWKLTHQGQLENIKIGERVTRWEEAQIQSFIESRRTRKTD